MMSKRIGFTRLADTGNCPAWWTRCLWIALIPALQVAALSSPVAVREVGPIGITVGDLDRVLPFYTNTLPFELQGIAPAGGAEVGALLGLSEAWTRRAELRLGRERLRLTEHLGQKGRPVPPDSRSFDHWFQHIAIVVRDMDQAYAHLRQARVKHVSTSPQTLPGWNKEAGGIRAFYFRDPEDHVLEIIWFPPGKGDPRWQPSTRAGGAPGTPSLFLGIDHTAIVVSDTEASLAFYRDALGLRVAGGAENHGVEQEHLNQVFGARLRITGLRAERGPGIELLEYLTPPGGRPLPADARANDLVFWTTELLADDVEGLGARLRDGGARFVSRPGAVPERIVRDPDGHALHMRPAASVTAAAK